MNLPDIHTQKLLDCLTHSRLGFALYRLPWTDECYLVLQTSGDVEQLADIQELNGKKGFVMAPFRISEEHPLVLIRPDVTAYDWSEISEALSSLECADALLTCKSRQSELSPFVSEETDKEQYTRAFGRFITPLQEKRFQKLVLSRSSARHIGDDFSPLGAFVRACNNYPRMMIYLCHTPASGTWLGSTPEILLSGHGKEWHTVALAGTMPMQNEVMPTDWDKKNVCGLPKEEAFRFIPDNEGYDRSYYSGFTGWLDTEGHTDIYVNLRCMEIKPGEAILYAGGGILASSEVESEWMETGDKMNTMRSILHPDFINK